MPHNLVITKPGLLIRLQQAAIALGADGFKKQFLPKSDSILHATKLLEKGQSETLEFNAPTGGRRIQLHLHFSRTCSPDAWHHECEVAIGLANFQSTEGKTSVLFYFFAGEATSQTI
jgi:hypothetical protein